MTDVRSILERGVGGVTPPPDGYDRMLRRHERKRRNQRIRAGALGLTIALGGILVASNAIRSGPVPGETPSPTPTQSEEPQPEPLVELRSGIFLVDIRTGEATRMSKAVTSVPGATNYDVSPDGTRLLFDNSLAPSAASQVYVANIDGTQVRQLTNDPDGALLASWSHDGTSILYIGRWSRRTDSDEEVTVFVVDPDTGKTTQVIDGPAGGLQEPRFSPDGRFILYTNRPSDPPDLWRVPVTGGIGSLFLADRGYASYSPDGTMLVVRVPAYYSSGHGGFGPFYELWLSNADGTDFRPFVREDPSDAEANVFNENPRWSPDASRILYSAGGVHVIDVATGETTEIGAGYGHDWIDDNTLMIERR
jgi:Tol biopolymer transport system component